MIVDSSAIIAILFGEPESAAFKRSIQTTARVQVSVANWLESAIRIDSKNNLIASHIFDELIDQAGIDLAAVTPSQTILARRAYQIFGKGTDHPAQLSFGDCFAYALAKETGEPLLFKGNDFRHTDIEAAL
ncbi:MAG: ribonuclease VapC28 [Hyphobacterium sp.]|nr:MAG: ribonuclease VapC28 [Hyphobacterium sp.]